MGSYEEFRGSRTIRCLLVCVYLSVCVYTYVCVCVCVSAAMLLGSRYRIGHQPVADFVIVYLCVCLCVCVCLVVCNYSLIPVSVWQPSVRARQQIGCPLWCPLWCHMECHAERHLSSTNEASRSFYEE